MHNIRSSAGLKDAIHLLEIEQAIKWQLLKEQFHQTYESLKPLNLLKSTLNDATSSPYLIENIIGTIIGLATGYLSKKLLVGKSGIRFRKLLGSVLQIGVSKLIAQNAEGIKRIGQLLFQKIFHKKETNFKIS